jgi:hypothetical protein
MTGETEEYLWITTTEEKTPTLENYDPTYSQKYDPK